MAGAEANVEVERRAARRRAPAVPPPGSGRLVSPPPDPLNVRQLAPGETCCPLAAEMSTNSSGVPPKATNKKKHRYRDPSATGLPAQGGSRQSSSSEAPSQQGLRAAGPNSKAQLLQPGAPPPQQSAKQQPQQKYPQTQQKSQLPRQGDPKKQQEPAKQQQPQKPPPQQQRAPNKQPQGPKTQAKQKQQPSTGNRPSSSGQASQFKPNQLGNQKTQKQHPRKQRHHRQPASQGSAVEKHKVVIRSLPPTMSQTAFEECLRSKELEGKYNYLAYAGGKVKPYRTVSSVAWLNFPDEVDLQRFYEHFHGHVFFNERGAPFKACVEYAPMQKVFSNARARKDRYAGTITEDRDYIEFLKDLDQQKEQPAVSAEVLLDQRDKDQAMAGDGKKVIVTPLMKFVMERQASRFRGKGKGGNAQAHQKPSAKSIARGAKVDTGKDKPQQPSKAAKTKKDADKAKGDGSSKAGSAAGERRLTSQSAPVMLAKRDRSTHSVATNPRDRRSTDEQGGAPVSAPQKTAPASKSGNPAGKSLDKHSLTETESTSRPKSARSSKSARPERQVYVPGSGVRSRLASNSSKANSGPEHPVNPSPDTKRTGSEAQGAGGKAAAKPPQVGDTKRGGGGGSHGANRQRSNVRSNKQHPGDLLAKPPSAASDGDGQSKGGGASKSQARRQQSSRGDASRGRDVTGTGPTVPDLSQLRHEALDQAESRLLNVPSHSLRWDSIGAQSHGRDNMTGCQTSDNSNTPSRGNCVLKS
eukprot:scaffold1383_cov360-Prasinococcus_capsulatus_cf.AAC.6